MSALVILLRDEEPGGSAAPGPSTSRTPGASATTSAAPTPSGSGTASPGATGATGGTGENGENGNGGPGSGTSGPGSGQTWNPNFVMPAGWSYRSDQGFRVPVPNGWTFGHDDDGRAEWRSPDGILLLIESSPRPKPDPVKDWQQQEANRRSGYANYRRVRLEAVPYWDSAADWEWTYTRNGRQLHVLNRGFITAPDQAYSIYWSTPASDWEPQKARLQTVMDGFIPRAS